MPAGHSALTSVLVKAGQAVEDDWKTLHANTPPGSLRQAIPNGRGGWVDLARYAVGATVPVAEGDLNAITDQFYPQAQGAVSALRGKDPFGKDSEGPKTARTRRGRRRAATRRGSRSIRRSRRSRRTSRRAGGCGRAARRRTRTRRCCTRR
jgi:hypothetical protein